MFGGEAAASPRLRFRRVFSADLRGVGDPKTVQRDNKPPRTRWRGRQHSQTSENTEKQKISFSNDEVENSSGSLGSGQTLRQAAQGVSGVTGPVRSAKPSHLCGLPADAARVSRLREASPVAIGATGTKADGKPYRLTHLRQSPLFCKGRHLLLTKLKQSGAAAAEKNLEGKRKHPPCYNLQGETDSSLLFFQNINKNNDDRNSVRLFRGKN